MTSSVPLSNAVYASSGWIGVGTPPQAFTIGIHTFDVRTFWPFRSSTVRIGDRLNNAYGSDARMPMLFNFFMPPESYLSTNSLITRLPSSGEEIANGSSPISISNSGVS